MAYKILAFDIDGTLTNSQKIITEELFFLQWTKAARFLSHQAGLSRD